MQAEMFAIFKALKYIQQNKNQYKNPITLYTDSKATLHILEQKRRNSKLANELINLADLLNEHQKINFNWIRAHRGNEYNELADKLAKRATTLDTETGYKRLPHKEIKRKIQTITTSLWQEEWTHSQTGRQCYKFFLNITERIKNKHFNPSFGITQCLTQHGNFGSYLFRFRKIDNMYCETDEDKEDNVYHYLYECKKYEKEGEQFQMKCLYAGFNWPPKETEIVNKKTLFRALEQYIRDTETLIRPYHRQKIRTQDNTRETEQNTSEDEEGEEHSTNSTTEDSD
ncbi:uncharacterized protein [Centruroides vittatus]|uniref:uncharacterized protein n=1 Tax=Centruroides vittatus TaxID=120091 RepID=UPI00350E9B0B